MGVRPRSSGGVRRMREGTAQPLRAAACWPAHLPGGKAAARRARSACRCSTRAVPSPTPLSPPRSRPPTPTQPHTPHPPHTTPTPTQHHHHPPQPRPAGKSTLLNTLTNAGVLAEDKLFATLDPTTRRVELPGGKAVLFTDTVGFIQKLPTQARRQPTGGQARQGAGRHQQRCSACTPAGSAHRLPASRRFACQLAAARCSPHAGRLHSRHAGVAPARSCSWSQRSARPWRRSRMPRCCCTWWTSRTPAPRPRCAPAAPARHTALQRMRWTPCHGSGAAAWASAQKVPRLPCGSATRVLPPR